MHEAATAEIDDFCVLTKAINVDVNFHPKCYRILESNLDASPVKYELIKYESTLLRFLFKKNAIQLITKK